MKRLIVSLLLLTSVSSFGLGRPGQWLFGGGIGLTASPEFFLINLQLEKVRDNRLSWGPVVQTAFGSGAAIFTASGVVRYEIGNHKRFRPSLEGGLGIAVGSSFADNLGVHILLGMGFDYIIEPGISIGTMIRGNFAPPLKTFFLSWPIAMVRVAL